MTRPVSLLGLLTVLATGNPSATPYAIGIVLGFLVGGFGHLIKSTPFILIGIGVILLTSLLFLLATDPSL